MSEDWVAVSCQELVKQARHILSWEAKSLPSCVYNTWLIQLLLVHTASDSNLHIAYVHAMPISGLKVSVIMICCKFNLFNIGIMYSAMSLSLAWRLKKVIKTLCIQLLYIHKYHFHFSTEFVFSCNWHRAESAPAISITVSCVSSTEVSDT